MPASVGIIMFLILVSFFCWLISKAENMINMILVTVRSVVGMVFKEFVSIKIRYVKARVSGAKIIYFLFIRREIMEMAIMVMIDALLKMSIIPISIDVTGFGMFLASFMTGKLGLLMFLIKVLSICFCIWLLKPRYAVFPITVNGTPFSLTFKLSFLLSINLLFSSFSHTSYFFISMLSLNLF